MSAAALLPDIPGKVHGLVSLDPPTVQCDGCGLLYSRSHLGLAVLTSGITFNLRAENDHRRMCAQCWDAEGWVDSPSRGWNRK